MALIGMQLI